MEPRLCFEDLLEHELELLSDVSLLSELLSELELECLLRLLLFLRGKAAFFLGRVAFSSHMDPFLVCGREYSRSFWSERICISIERFLEHSFESFVAKEPTSPVPLVEYVSRSHGNRVSDLYVSRLSMGSGSLSVRTGVSDGLLIEHISTPFKVKSVFGLDGGVFKLVFVSPRSAHAKVCEYFFLKGHARSPSALHFYRHESCVVYPFSISKLRVIKYIAHLRVFVIV